MSHSLTNSDHMVSGSNRTPWHGLGTVVAGQLSAIDALKTARLDWSVVQEPVFDGDMVQAEGYRLNRRNDNRAILGIVADTWEPLQNSYLLEIAESLVQVDGRDFKPVIETAGSLQGGKIVWALVRVGEQVFADSPHATYLLLSNGHDGKRALKGTLTDTRVVCQNTLRMAETSMGQLFVTHGRGVEARVKTAIETLGWANDATRATFAIYTSLTTALLQPDAANAYFTKLVLGDDEKLTAGGKARVDEMMELFRAGAGNAGRSVFDAVNAVTDWVDHRREYRDVEGSRIDERRFLFTTLGGQGDQLKVKAFRAAKQLAGV